MGEIYFYSEGNDMWSDPYFYRDKEFLDVMILIFKEIRVFRFSSFFIALYFLAQNTNKGSYLLIEK